MTHLTEIEAQLLFLLLSFFKILILIFGSTITYSSYRAYRHTADKSTLWFALGFGVTTIGTALAGLTANFFFKDDIIIAITLDSFFLVIGFGFIFYALIRTESQRIHIGPEAEPREKEEKATT